MSSELTKRFAHVLWIGGATDAGKSTIAENLASRHSMHVYHYNGVDAEHHEKLAKTVPVIQGWVVPEPQALLARSLDSFVHRFPLVLADLLALPRNKLVIAEGFGLLPELVHPVLSNPNQAVWLVPTETFKLDSMARRGKPSFRELVSDPEKAKAICLLAMGCWRHIIETRYKHTDIL
jgi:hypothetical protein